jgi:hypothetical protein
MAAELLGCAGLAAIVFAVVAYNSKTVYPSWRATMPVAGTALAILAGLASPQIAVARLLATRVMVAIGLVSYGWYLWHWPILSLMRIRRLNETVLLPDLIGGGVVAFVLACASYRYLEQPLRAWGRDQIRLGKAGRIVTGGTAVALGTALLTGAAGFGGYFATQALIEARYGTQGSGELDNGCRISLGTDIPDHCLTGRVVVLLGDSQAGAMVGSFTKKFAEQDVTLTSLYRGGCSPLYFAPSQRQTNFTHGCRNLMAPLDRLLALKGRVTGVMVTSAWDAYRQLLSSALLAELVTQFDPSTRILVLGAAPTFMKSGLDCVVLADRYGANRDACTRLRREVDAARASSLPALRSVTGRFDNVRFIDPIDLFCDATTCRPFAGNVVLYEDQSHVTPRGAELIYDAFRADFRWLTGEPSQPAAATQRQPRDERR